MTSIQLYWILKLDALRCACSVSLFLLFIILLVFMGSYGATNSDEKSFTPRFYKKLRKLMLFVIPMLSIAISGLLFIPSTKQMALILVVPKIVNNTEVQALPNKIVELANDWIDELKPESPKK